MRLILPKSPQGFCFGVKRAIEMVRSQSKPVAVLGQLVHNPGVIENLKKEQIFTINSPEEAPNCSVLATTAHGATKQIHQMLYDKKIVDTTCPYVERLQKTAKQLEVEGWKIVILGDASHPEIMSVTSFLENPTVVASLEQAKTIGFFDKIALVSQTTQTHEALEEVAAELKKHCTNLKVAETICFSTKERQEQVKELAQNAGAVIVVGGKKSANTRRLFELASKINPNSFWIESANEIDKVFC
ncbi:MAG: 4-hydroxy-3-methylbut-2-enyl diphosphate reductase, partial [Caldiserica bacterium]|nr:4-hydroxy-3-methylbut-2-enyl diphosphate reductase [Caldisericota bacterium]